MSSEVAIAILGAIGAAFIVAVAVLGTRWIIRHR